MSGSRSTKPMSRAKPSRLEWPLNDAAVDLAVWRGLAPRVKMKPNVKHGFTNRNQRFNEDINVGGDKLLFILVRLNPERECQKRYHPRRAYMKKSCLSEQSPINTPFDVVLEEVKVEYGTESVGLVLKDRLVHIVQQGDGRSQWARSRASWHCDRLTFLRYPVNARHCAGGDGHMEPSCRPEATRPIFWGKVQRNQV